MGDKIDEARVNLDRIVSKLATDLNLNIGVEHLSDGRSIIGLKIGIYGSEFMLSPQQLLLADCKQAVGAWVAIQVRNFIEQSIISK